MNNDLINDYYKTYNFPASAKLYKLLKEDGHDVRLKEVKDFLANQKEHEQLKIKQVKKKQAGHITAFTYKQIAQMDIFDISKYSSSNKNYKYLLVLIDVFTRKVFARPLKNKNTDDVINELLYIFKSYIPSVITSDSDKAFISLEMENFLNKNNIFHDVVIARNDHKALGIIDRFALNIKTTLSKLFLRNKNIKWLDYIDDIIENYNNTPHSSIEDLTPNDATNEKYQADIAIINRMKVTNKKIKSEFEPMDNVRIRIKDGFRKGSEPRYSDKIYSVIEVNGKRVTLDNDKTYLESDLIKTIIDDTTPNVINVLNKKNKQKKLLNRESLEEGNILAPGTKRKITKNKKYD